MKRIQIEVGRNVYYRIDPKLLSVLSQTMGREIWDKIDDTCHFLISEPSNQLKMNLK